MNTLPTEAGDTAKEDARASETSSSDRLSALHGRQGGAARAVDSAGLFILCAMVLLHPVVLGFVAPWADGTATIETSPGELLAVIPAFVLLPLAALSLAMRAGKFRLSHAVPFSAAALVLAWTAIQMVPLPAGIVAALSPAKIALWKELAPPGTVQGGWTTLSIQPHDTLIAFLRLGAAFCAFFAAYVFLRTGKRILVFASIAAATASALALLGIVDAYLQSSPGSGSTGLFPWGGEDSRASGPFFNANQFSGYMEIMFPLGISLGLALSKRRGRGESLRAFLGRFSGSGSRALLAVCAGVVMAGAVLMSRSRLGVLSFIGGGILLAAMLAGRLGMRARAAFAVAALVGAFFLYLGLDPLLNRYSLLLDGNVDRIEAWNMGARIAADFPVAGTGLGTFRRIAPYYQPPGLIGGYFETHNDYLNMASDIGLPGLALLLLMAVSWAAAVFKGLYRRSGAPVFAAAALSAAGAMAIHSAGDFNLQVPSIAMVFAVVAGMGLAAASGRPAGAGPEAAEGREA